MNNLIKKTILITLIATMLLASSMTVLLAHACESPVQIVGLPEGSSADISPLVYPSSLPGAITPTYNITLVNSDGQKYTGSAMVVFTFSPGALTTDQQNNLHIAQFEFLLGDVNHDGKVNLVDLLIITQALGSKPASRNWNPNADLNGDHKVDLKDLCLAVTNFGKTAKWIDLPTTVVLGDLDTATAIGLIDSGFGVH